MQLEITPELAEVRAALRKFTTEKLEPLALEIDRTGEVPAGGRGPAARAGLPRHAPAGRIRRRRLRPADLLPGAGGILALAPHVHAAAGRDAAASTRSPSRSYGTDAQKKKYVAGLANGTLQRLLRPDRARGGLRFAGHEDPGRAARRRLGAERPQALHHRRAQGRRRDGHGGHRPGEARPRRHHRLPGGARHAGLQRHARRHHHRLGGDQARRAHLRRLLRAGRRGAGRSGAGLQDRHGIAHQRPPRACPAPASAPRIG